MKRVIDLTIAIPGLILVSPLIAASALAVKLDSRGPAFYLGDRVGVDGRHFRIVKIRSMAAGADRTGPSVTSADDLRITRMGRLLRRTKLDELPQLWNVIRGDMSLVGPRPEHPDYVRLYTPDQRRVLSIRPGITSKTSLTFYDEERILAEHGGATAYAEALMPQKLALDLEYVEHHSVGGDFRILGQTFVFALLRLFRGGSR